MTQVKIFWLAALMLGSLTTAQAQDSQSQRTFSLEINPLAYAFSGWSVGGTFHPTKSPHWVFNAAAYGFQMPEAFVEQIPGNENKGFALRIRSAVTVGADYYPWSSNRAGWAFGLSTVLAGLEVTHPSEAGNARYSSFYVVPRLSYAWFVLDRLYLMPWVGMEFHTQVGGSTTVGVQTFAPMTQQFSPNLSIGYTFK